MNFIQQQSNKISKSFNIDSILDELRSQEILDIEKGGRRAEIGEKRMFGGREYIKTPNGWKFHGKGTGAKAQEHAKTADSHGKVETLRDRAAMKDEAAKKSENGRNEGSFERGGEVVVGRYKMSVIGYDDGRLKVSNKAGEKFTLSKKQTDELEKKANPSIEKEKGTYGSDMSDSELKERLDYHQTKEREAKKKRDSYKGHSKVRAHDDVDGDKVTDEQRATIQRRMRDKLDERDEEYKNRKIDKAYDILGIDSFIKGE